MALEWDFEHNIHGKFVTCQRPIVFTTYCSDISVLYFKSRMEIKNVLGDWIETDVLCRGYHNEKFNYFSFNVSEYVRNYFTVSKHWSNQMLCMSGGSEQQNQYIGIKEMFHREFRFNVWPVIQNPDLSTQELQDSSKFTREFNVIELNTKNNEITCLDPHNKTRIDNFVSGTCDGASYDNTLGEIDYLGSEYHRAMTNMPGLTPAGSADSIGPFNTINVNDGLFNAFLTSPWVYFTSKFQRIEYQFRNSTTGAWVTHNIDTTGGCPLPLYSGDNDQLMYYNISPNFIDMVLTDYYGAGDYIFSNTTNSLIIDRMSIHITTRLVSDNSLHRDGAKYTFNVTDKKNDGKCRRTKFVFKNMRGGIDWFSCYGTETKDVNLSSQRYSQNQDFSRGEDGFGIMSGQHSVTNVWTDRQESYSVITQPLTKDVSEWIEELIVSPQVWIEVDQIENETIDFPWPSNKTIIPIVIDTGSYSVYSTEDNVHFVEFKYSLSDNTLTQTGY